MFCHVAQQYGYHSSEITNAMLWTYLLGKNPCSENLESKTLKFHKKYVNYAQTTPHNYL